MRAIYIDNFDHDTDEPRKLRGAALDIHVLSTSKRVSVFWLTEFKARALRIDGWQNAGVLELDNSPQFPWLRVAKFDKERA